MSENQQDNKIDDYQKPSLTVDNLLFAIADEPSDNIRKLGNKKLQILLIKRNYEPFENCWGLPGAFMQMEESFLETSTRVLNEKMKLSNIYFEQLYTFDDIKRDPRTRVVSVAYLALINKVNVARSDDANLCWFTVEISKKQIVLNDEHGNKIDLNNAQLAFDHSKIIRMGVERLQNKVEYSNIVFGLMQKEFTIAELQQVFELILDKKFTKANFERKLRDKIEPTNQYRTSGFRPAMLYKTKEN